VCGKERREDRHDIDEILLKVALNTNNQSNQINHKAESYIPEDHK
jgi:hypothetical protein